MLESSPYPLLALKLLGTVCPCFEKRDDGPARRAAWTVSKVPIRWHRHPRPATNDIAAKPSSGGGGGVGGGGVGASFFSAFGAALGRGGGGISVTGGGGRKAVPLVGATLSVVDSPFGPRLVVSPPPAPPFAGGVGVRPKYIPLNCIKGVVRRPRGGIAVLDKKGVTLLRFDVLERTWTPVSDSTRDNQFEEEVVEGFDDADESISEVITQHLNTLIAWELRRRDYITTLGEDDATDNNAEEELVDEYDDDDNTANTPRTMARKSAIAEQAQRIKHFAQHEIELQRMKKEREIRKSKYVKEAGGLKYTAIAMANRS